MISVKINSFFLAFMKHYGYICDKFSYHGKGITKVLQVHVDRFPAHGEGVSRFCPDLAHRETLLCIRQNELYELRYGQGLRTALAG